MLSALINRLKETDHAMRNPYLGRARANVIASMQPMLNKCERLSEGPLTVRLRDRNSTRSFSPDELRAEWREGRFIRGPQWWVLVKVEEA